MAQFHLLHTLYISFSFFQGIWYIRSILGTGAGVTAFLFLIANTVRNYVDDDPETNGIAWIKDQETCRTL